VVQLTLVKIAGLQRYLRGYDDDDSDDNEMSTISDTSTSITTETTPAE